MHDIPEPWSEFGNAGCEMSLSQTLFGFDLFGPSLYKPAPTKVQLVAKKFPGFKIEKRRSK